MRTPTLVSYSQGPPMSGRLVCPHTASTNLTTLGNSQETEQCVPLPAALEPAQGVGPETKDPTGSLSAYSVCLVGLSSPSPQQSYPLSISGLSGFL